MHVAAGESGNQNKRKQQKGEKRQTQTKAETLNSKGFGSGGFTFIFNEYWMSLRLICRFMSQG